MRVRPLSPRTAPGRWRQVVALIAVVATTLVLVGASRLGDALAAEQIQLTVDASKAGAKIDRNLFGQFAEHLGHGVYEGVWVGPDSSIPNTRGIRNDVVAALKALKVPNVRWPGGCFADEYHWRKGIGTRDGVTEPELGRRDRAEHLRHARVHGLHRPDRQRGLCLGERRVGHAAGSRRVARVPDHRSADDAGEGAGGERTPGAVQGGVPGHRQRELGLRRQHDAGVLPQSDEDLQPLRQELQSGAAAGRAADAEDRRGPRRRRAAVDRVDRHDHEGLAGTHVELGHRRVVDALLHGAEVAAVDAPRSGSARRSTAEILKTTLEMDGLIAKHSAIMDKYDPQKKIALVVDEWGAWYAPLPGSNPGFLVQQNSLRDAVLAALNLNILARHADRVRMANIAQMINVLQAMILTDKETMVLTPTYHVFRMYVPFQDATFVPVTFDAGTYTHGDVTLPRIDAIAARDAAGTLWLAVTNLDPTRPVDIAARLSGIGGKTATGETLTAPAVDSVNTFDAPETVTPKPVSAKVQGDQLTLTLEPKSVTVLSVRP